MTVDNLYDSLFTTLALISPVLTQPVVEEVHGRIERACAQARVTATALQSMNELSSYLESKFREEDIRSAFRAILRPWINLQELRNDLGTAEENLRGIERSGRSGDEVLTAILGLTQKIDTLRHKILAAEAGLARPEVKGPQTCAGLRNSGNRCFMHGIEKGLWASQAFRQLVAEKAKLIETGSLKEGASRTALFLDRLFQKLDVTPASKILEPDDEAVQGLVTELRRRHKELLDGQQHDAAEFLAAIFSDIFAEGEHLLSYDVAKDRPPELGGNFVIPTIDLKEHIDANIFLVNLPPQEGADVDLQQAVVSSFAEETIEPEAVAASDRNAGVDREEIFRSLQGVRGGIQVHRNVVFSAPPPRCLIIQLVPAARRVSDLDPRLKDLKPEERAIIEADAPKKSVKVSACVHVPALLSIRCASERLPSPYYMLKGVVIHTGEQRTGHYFTYVPCQEPGLSAAAVANHFICHNDSVVSKLDIREGALHLQKDAYLLVYDLVPIPEVDGVAASGGEAPAAREPSAPPVPPEPLPGPADLHSSKAKEPVPAVSEAADISPKDEVPAAAPSDNMPIPQEASKGPAPAVDEEARVSTKDEPVAAAPSDDKSTPQETSKDAVTVTEATQQ